MLIDPRTNNARATTPTLDPQQVYTAFVGLDTKLNGLGSQTFNLATLIEFLMDKLNSYEVDGKFPLAINEEELQTFYDTRLQEVQAEFTRLAQDKLAQAS